MSWSKYLWRHQTLSVVFTVFNRVKRLEIQSVMLVYSTPLVSKRPSNLLIGSSTLPTPLPCVNKYCTSTCIHTVCKVGGFPVWIITVVHVFIQWVTWGGWIGGLRQINTCRQVPLLVNLIEKPKFRVWWIFSQWSMCTLQAFLPKMPNPTVRVPSTVLNKNLWVRVTCEQDPLSRVIISAVYQARPNSSATHYILNSILYVPISCSSLLWGQ